MFHAEYTPNLVVPLPPETPIWVSFIVDFVSLLAIVLAAFAFVAGVYRSFAYSKYKRFAYDMFELFPGLKQEFASSYNGEIMFEYTHRLAETKRETIETKHNTSELNNMYKRVLKEKHDNHSD